MPADLPRLVDPAERVVELLAIKLFEHVFERSKAAAEAEAS